MCNEQFTLLKKRYTFRFKKLCPYCQADMTYQPYAWEQEDDGTWTATEFDKNCLSEPNMGTEEWDDWLDNHSEMPYVHQLPVDTKVQKWINENYRFKC